MNILTPTQRQDLPLVMIKLAREIACDLYSIEKILEHHDVSREEFAALSENTAFQALLAQQIAEWNSAINTVDRVKVKAAAFVEEALPEFYARAHDAKEPLSAKVEILKAVSRFAGIGGTVDGGGVHERMTVTINLGADSKLSFTKDVTPRTIDGDSRAIEEDAL